MVIKKTLILICTFLCANMLLAQQGNTLNGLTYAIIGETQNVSVKAGDSAISGEIIIPETIQIGEVTYNVTQVEERGFKDCNAITSVTIPSTITEIGDDAFYSCANLTHINFNAIDCEDFKENGNIHPFCNTPITTVTIGEGVERIPAYFCDSKHNLTDVTFSNTVREIGDYAFDYCSSLNSVTFPDGLKIIGNYSFRQCYKFDTITLPEGLTTLGEGVFANCSTLTSITIPNSVTSFGFGAFALTPIRTIDLPDNITIIPTMAFFGCEYLEEIEIPASVKKIDYAAFLLAHRLENITLNEGLQTIGYGAFAGDSSLVNVYIPSTVDSIGGASFLGCVDLESINIPESVTAIGDSAFRECYSLTTITIPENVTYIGKYAFYDCVSLETLILLCKDASNLYLGDNFVNFNHIGNISLVVPFDNNYSDMQEFIGLSSMFKEVSFLTQPNETTNEIELDGKFTVTDKIKLQNEGFLRIKQGAELINETTENVNGIIEVETKKLPTQRWSFVGAPFTGQDNKYKLESIIPGSHDVSVSMFDYGTGKWSEDWADVDTEVGAGEGFFLFSWAEEEIAFTTYGDGIHSPNADEAYNEYNYDYERSTDYLLNNADVTVAKTIVESQAPASGYWMALANPYTFKLDVAKFLGTNNTQDIQGLCVYRLNNESVFEFMTTDQINVTEGFFVNFVTGGNKTITFNKSQRYTVSSKSSAQREFVKLALVDGEKEVEVLFAHNESAEQEYDIYDANKLFSPIEIAEPYFVTDGIALVKEEVKQLPYYATMNVRSYENKEITFKANNIPSGIIVRIIDGEEIITLSEDATYTTNITVGENADRFKVLFEQARQLADPTAHNITITNHNRTVNISTAEDDLTIKVYNALGQVVLTTKDYNFTLSKVPAGAYMIKAFNKTVSETAKIVVK